MPEMVLQVIYDGLNLVIKGQRPKVAACLSAGDIETPIHQALAQAGCQLAAVAWKVVDGAVGRCSHVLIVTGDFAIQSRQPGQETATDWSIVTDDF